MVATSEGRVRLRYTLGFIILATLPCYCMALVLLQLAPDRRQALPTPPTLITLTPAGFSATPSFTPSVTASLPPGTPSPTVTLTPTVTVTPTFTMTATPTDTATASGTPTPSSTPSVTSSPSPTVSPTFTLLPTHTDTPAFSPTVTQTRSAPIIVIPTSGGGLASP